MSDDPLEENGEGAAPLVTCALFAYNQEGYVAQAIESAFAQTYSPLEIILSDDASSDGTFAVMESMAAAYDGPHKVVLNRNEQNVGIASHVNRLFELASGELIVPLAGDDVSEPNRAAVLTDAFLANNRPMLLHSNWRRIDKEGQLIGGELRSDPTFAKWKLQQIAKASRGYLGAACAWNPDLVNLFGPITELDAYEDLVFQFRAALAGKTLHVDEPLVRYRVGGSSGARGPAVDHRLRGWRMRRAVSQQRLLDCEKRAPRRVRVLYLLRKRVSQFEAALNSHLSRAAE